MGGPNLDLLLVVVGLIGVLLIVPAIMLVVLVLAKRHTPKNSSARRAGRSKRKR